MRPRRELRSYVTNSLSIIVASLAVLYIISFILVPVVRNYAGQPFDWKAPFQEKGKHEIQGAMSMGLMLVRALILIIEAVGIALVVVEPLRKLDFIGSFIFIELLVSLAFLSTPGWRVFFVLLGEVLFCWLVSLGAGAVYRSIMNKRLAFKRKY